VDISSNLPRTFLAVSEHGNFSLAAAALQKSQSNVSTQISQLEEQIGLKLFHRDKRPFRLTEAGTKFLQFAREVSNKIRDVDRKLKDVGSGTAGEVRIGATDSIAAYLLPKIIARLVRNHPKITIYVVTEIARRLFEYVREGEIDFALTLPDNPPRDLHVKPLAEESFCFVASPKHPLARTTVASKDQLRNVAFVAGQRGTGHDTMVQRVLDRAGIFDYEIRVRISTYEGVKQLLYEGCGVSVLPTFAVQDEIKEKKLVRLKTKGIDLSTTLFLVKRLDSSNTPAVSLAEDFIETSIMRDRERSKRNRGEAKRKATNMDT